MSLAIFDLDNTLIAGDSDHLWGEFLIEQGRVDPTVYQAENDRFYRDYQNGGLDIHAYLAFALEPLRGFTPTELADMHQTFMALKIDPIWLPKAEALIEDHRRRGDTLLIITATNRFITEPIARKLGVPYLLASEPELVDGRYTGRATGTPCYQDGKVTRLREWLALTCESLAGEPLKNSYFYSDSANDIPLLEVVSHPIAVDPDPRLLAYAQNKNIPIISLR